MIVGLRGQQLFRENTFIASFRKLGGSCYGNRGHFEKPATFLLFQLLTLTEKSYKSSIFRQKILGKHSILALKSFFLF